MKTKPISNAYVSGAICGNLWWPQTLAGQTLNKSARGPWGFMSKGDSFRDALLSLLMREGGDFRAAQFTADTVLRIEMRFPQSSYRWITRVKEYTLAQLGCADLVNSETETFQFCGSNE